MPLGLSTALLSFLLPKLRRMAERQRAVNFYFMHHTPMTECTYTTYDVLSLPTILVFDHIGEQVDKVLCTVPTLSKLTDTLKRTWGV